MPEPSSLVSWMDSGAAVLVAYDCEKNHEPAMRNGRGAHWAILVRAAIALIFPNVLDAFNNCYAQVGYLYVETNTTVIRSAADVSVDDEHAFYVFAFHGKSRFVGIVYFRCLDLPSSLSKSVKGIWVFGRTLFFGRARSIYLKQDLRGNLRITSYQTTGWCSYEGNVSC